jgi:amino acid adenylation domain-containing protein
MSREDDATDDEIAGLSAEQRELLDQLVAGRTRLSASQPSPPTVGPEPLSPSQIELWMCDQLVPGTSTNNVACWVSVDRVVDPARLQAALDRLVERHEALRATLVEVAGEPRWQLPGALPLELHVTDLRALPAGDRRAAARAAGEAWIRRPFHLAGGRLVHIGLYRIDDTRCELLVVAHHAVADGWSMALLVRDLVAIEAASDRDPGLPALAVTYTGLLALLRRDREQPERAARSLEFWRALLSAGHEPVTLAHDRVAARPPVGATARAVTRLAPGVLGQVRELQRREAVSWVSVVLAALAGVLSRMSRAERVCVGVFASGRGHPAARDHVGSLSRIMPLPFDLSDRREFAAVVRDTHRALARSAAHEDVTSTEIARAMELARPDGMNPLFRVAVSVQPRMPSLETQRASFDDMPYEAPGAGVHDLLISVFDRADDLALAVDYRRDAYDASTVESFLHAFEVLLEAATARPEVPVAALPLVRPAEWARWIARTAGPVTPRAQAGIVAQFEATAARDPGRVAVSCLDRRLTYAELAARVAAVAYELRERGVDRGDAVLLDVERGPCWPIAMLATLAAGGYFVPVGPAWPRDQIEFVIAETRPVLAVVDAGGAERLRGLELPRCVVDSERAIPAHPATHPAAVGADDLAYLIYTSGSTGRPKGVRLGHGGLSNIVEELRERPGIAASDVMLNVANIAFDLSISDLLVAVTTGARFAIAPEHVLLDERELARLIDQEGVTAMCGTPSLWRLLVASGWTGKSDLVAWVGGEALPIDLARALCGCCAAVWNLYGPTEASIWTTIGRVAPDAPRVSLGTAIRNASVVVLDGDRQPVPAAAVGELWIAGAGVGLGYQGRPELEASVFCELELPAGRVRGYRTGDLVRLHADDSLEFVGRIDDQVKLRGHRIELGHIEAVARELPEVVAAAAVVRVVDAWDERLILYVVATSTRPGLPDVVRRQLAAVLPAYMVPSRIVQLDRLPRNANGKLDLSRLPLEPDHAAGPLSAGAPLDAMEQRVLAHWAAVLQCEIDPDRQFFEQGGHSFLLVTLRQRLEQDLGRTIPTSMLYRYPTVRALASHLSRDGEDDDRGDAMTTYRDDAARRLSKLAALRTRRS